MARNLSEHAIETDAKGTDMKQTLINLVERRVIPDPITRIGMRRMIGDRLQNEYVGYTAKWHGGGARVSAVR